MEIVLLSGLSGSGKSTALAALEDSGYFAVDNLPFSFLKKFIEIVEYSNKEIDKLAVVCDARDPQIESNIKELKNLVNSHNPNFTLIFLEADKATLIKRFEQTRRAHPLSVMHGLTLENAIEQEVKLLKPIREISDYIIDTTNLNVNELRRFILGKFRNDRTATLIQLISFGFKYGLPPEADTIFDVRFIPNPFFVEKLKNSTGLDKETAEFVLNQPQTKKFLSITERFFNEMLPLYTKEGKSYITTAFGCTGGKHRSVAIVEYFKKILTKQGYSVDVIHRDIDR